MVPLDRIGDKEMKPYVDFDNAIKLFKDLAHSQGFYGRLLRNLEDEEVAERFRDWLEENKLPTEIDLILAIEG